MKSLDYINKCFWKRCKESQRRICNESRKEKGSDITQKTSKNYAFRFIGIYPDQSSNEIVLIVRPDCLDQHIDFLKDCATFPSSLWKKVFWNPLPFCNYIINSALSEQFCSFLTNEEKDKLTKYNKLSIYFKIQIAFHLCSQEYEDDLITSTFQWLAGKCAQEFDCFKGRQEKVSLNWEMTSTDRLYSNEEMYEVRLDQSMLKEMPIFPSGQFCYQQDQQGPVIHYHHNKEKQTPANVLSNLDHEGLEYQTILNKLKMLLFPSGFGIVGQALVGLIRCPLSHFQIHHCLFQNQSHFDLLQEAKAWYHCLLCQDRKRGKVFQITEIFALLNPILHLKEDKTFIWTNLGSRSFKSTYERTKHKLANSPFGGLRFPGKRQKLSNKKISECLDHIVDPFVYIFEGLLFCIRMLERGSRNHQMTQNDGYENAIAIMKLLLSEQTAVTAGTVTRKERGHLWNRLVIDSIHVNRRDEAFHICSNALEDPLVTGAFRLELESRMRLLWSKLVRPSQESLMPTPPKMGPEMHFPQQTIRRQRANGKLGKSSRLLFVKTGPGKEEGTVEEVALEYYQSMGWRGLHAENRVFTTLFFLLLWEEIFDPNIEDAFYHPFQQIPIDLHWQGCFRTKRQKSLGIKLKQISQSTVTELQGLIQSSWSQRYGVQTRINWEYFCLNDLLCIASGAGGKAVSKILSKLASDYARWCCGFPDLILWKHPGNELTDQGCLMRSPKVKVVEVKGPTDTLSQQQKLWLRSLQTFGIPIEVCYIEPN